MAKTFDTEDIGLICVGSEITIPITNLSFGNNSILEDFYITIEFPSELELSNTSLSKGLYTSSNNRWTVGTLGIKEVLNVELKFNVLDDTVAKFNIILRAHSGDTCFDDEICIIAEGLSCTELNKCDSELAIDDYFVVPKNSINYPGDVSTNDGNCPLVSIVRTYQWIDVTSAQGVITGTPDNFLYTPTNGFCGYGFAKYGLYCNGVLIDDAEVVFSVTCATPIEDEFAMKVNSSLSDTVSSNDVPCINGGTTLWILSSEPTADGAGLSEPTSHSDVTVVEWDQQTGDFEVFSANDFEGIVTFEYM